MENNMKKEQKEKAFSQHRNNAFYLKFPNGNALSTIWGAGSYTENHNRGFEKPYSPENFQKAWNERMDSDDVETMPSCSESVKKILDEKFPDNENGSVFSNLNFTQWLEMVNILNTNK